MRLVYGLAACFFAFSAHSGLIRSGIPITSGQPFRFDPVTDSGVPVRGTPD